MAYDCDQRIFLLWEKVGCYVTHDETSEEEHVRHSVAMQEERRYRDCPPIVGGEVTFAVILKELRKLIYAYKLI